MLICKVFTPWQSALDWENFPSRQYIVFPYLIPLLLFKLEFWFRSTTSNLKFGFQKSISNYISFAYSQATNIQDLGTPLKHPWSTLERLLKHAWNILETPLRQISKCPWNCLKHPWNTLSITFNHRMNESELPSIEGNSTLKILKNIL